MKRNTMFEPLPQYHFDRDAFVAACREILGDGGIDAMTDACVAQARTDRFLLAWHEDEYYVVHKDSGIVVNWYKHLGRTNTCSKPSMSIEGFKDFLAMLKEDLGIHD